MLTIKFTDGEIVQGGGWNTLPNKPIQKIAFTEKDKKIILQGYESYNHLREHVYAVINPEDKGGTFIRAIYLIGKDGDSVTVIKYNTMTNEITQSFGLIGQEYNGRPSTGWKKGSPTLNPQFFIT